MDTETLRINQISECTICRGSLRSETTVYCAACLSRYHPDCFADHSQCAVIGCMETRAVRPLETATEVPQEATLPTKTLSRSRSSTSSRTTVLVAMFALTLTTGIGLTSVKIVNDRLDSLTINAPAPIKAEAPALPALTEKERFAEVQRLAAISKTRNGTEQSVAVAAIYLFLEDRDSGVRDQAAMELGKIPADSSDVLLKKLDHWDKQTRFLICESLANQAETYPKIISALEAKLKVEKPVVCLSALYSLRMIGDSAKITIPKIYPLIENEDKKIREYAFDALQALTTKDQGPEICNQLAKFSKNSNPLVRAKALRVLADTVSNHCQSKSKDAFIIFENALKDRDPAVRGSAIKSIEDLSYDFAEECKKRLPQLILAVRDENVSCRIEAIKLVGRLGKKDPLALKAMFIGLKDKEESARKQANQHIYKFQINADKLLPVLVVALKDSNVQVRRAAAYLYSTYVQNEREPIFVKEMIEGLNDVDKRVRQSIIRSLYSFERRAEPAIPALLTLLRNTKKSSQRYELVSVLGVVGKKSSLIFEPLLEQIGDPDFSLSNKAVSVLTASECETKLVIPHLLRAIKDSRHGIRLYALALLTRRGAEARSATPALLKLLSDPMYRSIRNKIIQTISDIGADSSEAVIALLGSLNGKERENVRKDVARFLEKLQKDVLFVGSKDSNAVLKALTGALNDPDITIRERTAKALGRFGPDAHEAIPALIHTLSDETVFVRDAGTAALLAIGPKVLPAISKAFLEGNEDVKIQAARVIGGLGAHSKGQLEALRLVLENGELKNKETSTAIKAAISQIKRSLRREGQ